MEPTDLEQRILETAERLFLERGFAQTSTTDIARAVGCNQALVHYYYRTKEKLFRGIFSQKIDALLTFMDTYTYQGDIWATLEALVEWYFSFLSQNRQLPFFVLNELVLNEDRRMWIRDTIILNPNRQKVYDEFVKIVDSEIAKGNIRPIEPLDLLLNTVSLVVMTFISLPIYQDLLQRTPEQVDEYLLNRKQEVLCMLRNGLRN